MRGVVGGSWYFEDDYPDSHLLADAEDLRTRHAPDLLFVHPMGLDNAGHVHGGGTDAYKLAARKLDMPSRAAVAAVARGRLRHRPDQRPRDER